MVSDVCPENRLHTLPGLSLDSRFQAGQDDGSLRDSSGMLRNMLRIASANRSVWPRSKSIPLKLLRCLYSHPDLSSSLRLSCYPAFHRSLAGRPGGYFHPLLVPPMAAWWSARKSRLLILLRKSIVGADQRAGTGDVVRNAQHLFQLLLCSPQFPGALG
ncbi:MAG: hypothetical protein PWQ99_108 [Clostridia bacterium]|nr:hypothetical protein [Clostridia bacterium]MDN5375084.1 hypothetical protein [Thermacetogenium sp.]